MKLDTAAKADQSLQLVHRLDQALRNRTCETLKEQTQVLRSQSRGALYFYFTSAQRLFVVFHYICLTAVVTSYFSDYSSARSCTSRCACDQLRDESVKLTTSLL